MPQLALPTQLRLNSRSEPLRTVPPNKGAYLPLLNTLRCAQPTGPQTVPGNPHSFRSPPRKTQPLPRRTPRRTHPLTISKPTAMRPPVYPLTGIGPALMQSNRAHSATLPSVPDQRVRPTPPSPRNRLRRNFLRHRAPQRATDTSDENHLSNCSLHRFLLYNLICMRVGAQPDTNNASEKHLLFLTPGNGQPLKNPDRHQMRRERS